MHPPESSKSLGMKFIGTNHRSLDNPNTHNGPRTQYPHSRSSNKKKAAPSQKKAGARDLSGEDSDAYNEGHFFLGFSRLPREGETAAATAASSKWRVSLVNRRRLHLAAAIKLKVAPTSSSTGVERVAATWNCKFRGWLERARDGEPTGEKEKRAGKMGSTARLFN